MGYGTGVLRAYYAVSLMRGFTVGVSGASSMYIAQKSGAPQNFLVAARGIGLVVAPMVLARLIGRMVWSGNAQYGWSVALICKVIAELVIARATNPLPLYAAFMVIGVTMALLDTSAQMLITRVHKENCGLPMMIYCAVYGVGCTFAPYLTLHFSFRAWEILALMDLVVALVVAGRRAARGKPKDWKRKIRGPPAAVVSVGSSDQESGAPEANALRPLPGRVLRAGMSFVFIAQATETAMSCWAFTFAATTLGLPATTAALFHSTFYFSFTATRLLVLPISMRLLPSAIAQAGTMLTLAGSCLFFTLTRGLASSMVTAYPEGDVSALLDDAGAISTTFWTNTLPLLVSLALIGAGSCPLYAMMLGAVRRHGDLNTQEQGMFMTSYSSGITVGMWLPGLVPLPYMEMVGAACLFLIMVSHVREFPWWESKVSAGRKA